MLHLHLLMYINKWALKSRRYVFKSNLFEIRLPTRNRIVSQETVR